MPKQTINLCIIIIILHTILPVRASAQADLVVIRKKGHTVRTFFSGAVASFTTTSGETVTTKIDDIRNDSIFFKELVVKQMPTPWGVTRLDTLATIQRVIHFSEIAAIPRTRKFSQVSISGLLMIGGGGFMALNLINSAYMRMPPFEDNNLKKLLPAAGAFATGFALQKLKKNQLLIGKKYTVHYIPMRSR